VVRADEESSEAIIQEGRVSFKTDALTVAGQHTFVAEWQEHRPGLPHLHERSPAATLTVAPGPPADAQVPLLQRPPCPVTTQLPLQLCLVHTHRAWKFEVVSSEQQQEASTCLLLTG
jgi:hypothetical protein